MYLPALIHHKSRFKLDYSTAVSTFFGDQAALLSPTNNLIINNVHKFSEDLTLAVLKDSVPWIFNDYFMKQIGKGYFALFSQFPDIQFNCAMPRAPRIEGGRVKLWLDARSKTAQQMEPLSRPRTSPCTTTTPSPTRPSSSSSTPCSSRASPNPTSSSLPPSSSRRSPSRSPTTQRLTISSISTCLECGPTS